MGMNYELWVYIYIRVRKLTLFKTLLFGACGEGKFSSIFEVRSTGKTMYVARKMLAGGSGSLP
jgi:hypothetical protein